MSEFTRRHDDQLYEFFAGVFDGRCGLKSHLGGMLEALRNGDVEHGPRTSDCMPVKPQSRHANRDFDVSEDMLEAARVSRRIEKALKSMPVEFVNTLRAHYLPRPREAMAGGVVADLGETKARELGRLLGSEDREERREGKRLLSAAEHRAGQALQAAQEGYAVAEEAIGEVERLERWEAFMRRLA